MRQSAQYCLIEMHTSPASQPVPAQSVPSQSGRILDGALACVARVGLGKTTLDDVAREAGCARATVYRCFPGKQALFRALLDREITALGARVVEAASRAETLADAVVAVIGTGAEAFRTHPALAFVLAHEPELITPQLSFERGSALLRAAAAFAAPAFTRFLSPDRAERLGEWVARLALSYLCNPTDEGQLDDPAYVRALVADYVLPGITRTHPTFASAAAGEGALP
jgi:AcrR family transcriptional regulator